MRAESTHHNGVDVENLKNKRTKKEDYENMDKNYIVEIEDKEKDLQGTIKDIQADLEVRKISLIAKYDNKMMMLRKELELRTKVQVHELEERMNQHINDLMSNHQASFQEMKAYYNDITSENIELIKTHRDKFQDIKSQIENNQQTAAHLKSIYGDLQLRLSEATPARDALRKKVHTFEKDEMGLRNVRGVLKDLNSKTKQLKIERDVLDKQVLMVEKQKRDMYEKFEIAIEQLRGTADFKNV